jgi:hypothetical protein
MNVVKVVDEDIGGKVDTNYIEEQLLDIANVTIVYICTSEGGEEDDWIDDESGVRYLVIHLPYKEVKRLADARPLMLKKAKERLGLKGQAALN